MADAGGKVGEEGLFGVGHPLRLLLQPDDGQAEAEEDGGQQVLGDHAVDELGLGLNHGEGDVVTQTVPDSLESLVAGPLGHFYHERATEPKLKRNKLSVSLS